MFWFRTVVFISFYELKEHDVLCMIMQWGEVFLRFETWILKWHYCFRCLFCMTGKSQREIPNRFLFSKGRYRCSCYLPSSSVYPKQNGNVKKHITCGAAEDFSQVQHNWNAHIPTFDWNQQPDTFSMGVVKKHSGKQRKSLADADV